MIVNKNIYLIGMPGSGKTTIGLLVSSILNCHFYEIGRGVSKVSNSGLLNQIYSSTVSIIS